MVPKNHFLFERNSENQLNNSIEADSISSNLSLIICFRINLNKYILSDEKDFPLEKKCISNLDVLLKF